MSSTGSTTGRVRRSASLAPPTGSPSVRQSTPRNWVEHSILRTGPVLLGLYSVVCLIYHQHQKRHNREVTSRPGYDKTEPTFIDVLATVRGLFWKHTFFAQPYFAKLFQNLKPKFQATLLAHFSQAV